jgi:hypothetical protein
MIPWDWNATPDERLVSFPCDGNLTPRGFEVPVTAGVTMRDLLTVSLSAGTIDHVINDSVAPATTAAIGVPSTVVSFP